MSSNISHLNRGLQSMLRNRDKPVLLTYMGGSSRGECLGFTLLIAWPFFLNKHARAHAPDTVWDSRYKLLKAPSLLDNDALFASCCHIFQRGRKIQDISCLQESKRQRC